MELSTIRIAIRSNTKDRLARYCEMTGTTQIMVMSKLVDWFIEQQREIQAIIQGHLPSEILTRVSEFVAKELALNAD